MWFGPPLSVPVKHACHDKSRLLLHDVNRAPHEDGFADRARGHYEIQRFYCRQVAPDLSQNKDTFLVALSLSWRKKKGINIL